MIKKFAFLFDLDGVILDSESQYSVFWKTTGEKYHLGIENFDQLVKGTTLYSVLSTYFSHLSDKQQKEIEQEFKEFDVHLKIVPIEGIVEFLSEIQARHLPIGLVTSSDYTKLDYVFQQLSIKPFFHTIISAECVQWPKPHPFPYLKAAETLRISPEHCFVFEDSRNGIKSGNAAGMSVIGLSTTLPADSICPDCVKVIPNFLHFHLSDIEDLLQKVS